MTRARTSRRDWLRQASRVAAGLPFVSSAHLASDLLQRPHPAPPQAPERAPLFENDPTKYRFTRDEDEFLEDIERTSFQFFWNETNPVTGLVKDRSHADGTDQRNAASIAATGFGLTAHCIADQRGWEQRMEIRDRVRNTLRFVATRVQHEHGFYAHFLNIQNGERVFQSEVSSIDTAIFLCGVLTCRAYFDDAEIYELATPIFERVDWNWMLQNKRTLSMGWTPEHGFLRTRWDSYSELMMIYLLGLGSASHALPIATWSAWSRPNFEFNGIRYIGAHAPSLRISIPTPGSIFAAGAIASPTISPIPSSPPRSTNCGAWSWRSNSPITAKTCGASPPPTLRAVTRLGEAPGNGPYRRFRRSLRHRWFAAVLAAGNAARSAFHSRNLYGQVRRRLPSRLRGRLQSAHQLVQRRPSGIVQHHSSRKRLRFGAENSHEIAFNQRLRVPALPAPASPLGS